MHYACSKTRDRPGSVDVATFASPLLVSICYNELEQKYR